MLERVHRAWDRLHQRPLLYRRVGDRDDATPPDEPQDDDDWRPTMTASLYCPGPDGEPTVDCRPRKAERCPPTKSGDAADCRDWCSLTLGRSPRRCRHCAAAATATAVLGDHATTSLPSPGETLPRFKSPVLGRRLPALVADDDASAGSGSVSCPGSPRDITRLSAAVGRRLQLGLSPRLCPRRTHRRRTDIAVDTTARRPSNKVADGNLPTMSNVNDGRLRLRKSENDVIVSRDHARDVLDRMATRFASQQLCDVVLTSGKRRIPAHRLVLSAASDRLAAMLSLCDVSSVDVPAEINIPDVDVPALDDVINYIYTGRLRLSGGNVEPVLTLAVRWQLEQVVDACCSFLGDHLRPSNCLTVLRLADDNRCSGLKSIARFYIAENFASVMTAVSLDEWARLAVDDVVDLLSSDELNVPDQRTVLDAALMWLDHHDADDDRRRRHAARLLAAVKLPLLTPQCITDRVMSERLFKNVDACQDMIVEALKYHLLPDRRQSMYSRRAQPRKSYIGQLFAFGANDSGGATVEQYCPRSDSWTAVASLPRRRLQFAVAVVGHRVYVVGGRDGLLTLDVVQLFDVSSRAWTSITAMNTHRHGLGAAVLGGALYAVGGHDGWSYLSSVERFDPDTEVWTHVAAMSAPRSTLGVAVVGSRLFAVGGRDGTACLGTVEFYSPHTDSWTACSPLSRCRAGAGVAACNGFVYVVGGHDSLGGPTPSPVRLDSLERYDPRSDSWTTLSSISRPRDAVGLCGLGDRLYVVGGCDDDQRYVAVVECYDTLTSRWTPVSSMNVGRAGPCVVSIDTLKPDMATQYVRQSLDRSTEETDPS